VRLQVRVIIALSGVPPAKAAKSVTTTIPVVFTTGSNPVEAGLVATLNRPGGNLTGITSLDGELGPKRLEVLHELVPAATDFGFLVNPTNPYDLNALPPMVQTAASGLGLGLRVLHASAEHEFNDVFSGLSQLRVQALVVSPDTLFVSRDEQLAALGLRYGVPMILPGRSFTAHGGLASYGGDVVAIVRQVGLYAGRILNGDKPSDLAVQQATKVALTLNLKTAKALGINVPLALLTRADEVIE
jgi:putative ABC transport system substrate-binding protein